jgi:tetratricopeptide (TPR) repeat protein
MTERWLAANSPESAATLSETIKAHPATALEVAADYMDAGLWQDGTALLASIVAAASDKSKVSPLVYYYLGYCAVEMHEDAKAREYYQLAAKAPTDYAFPFQMEMIAVLEDAMRVDPSDARAPYYLGDLLYDWQPQQALALWEKSASMGADFPVVYRNLAMVYLRQGKQRDKALAALERAVQFGGSATVFNELDKLYEENGVSPAKRLAVMEAHQAVIDRDDAIAREINLEIFVGKSGAAIQLLKSRFFRAWEGGGSFSLGDSWINANLDIGHRRMIDRQYAQAMASYQAALDIPVNLQGASGDVSYRKAEVSYWIGNAYEAMGDAEKARRFWSDASSAPRSEAARDGDSGSGAHGPAGGRASIGGLAAGVRVEQAALYYQAMALMKLGQADRARAIFEQLISIGLTALAKAPDSETPIQPYAAESERAQAADAHYLAGLGQLGLNNRDQARQQFSLALKASPDHYAAVRALTEMGP